MTQLTERILAAADTHTSLLGRIADVEHAPATLEMQQSYLNDLQSTLTKLKTELEKLRKVTSKERKEHQDLRDSFARRYAHKLTGQTDKFISKVEKEEREYLEAHANQQAAEEKERYLEETISDTQTRVAELSVQSQQYEDLVQETKELYKRVFEGPTPEFPEEDQMEAAVAYAKEFYFEAESRYNSDHEAQKIMIQAEKAAVRAVSFCDSALTASTMDLWGGGALADVVERDNLSKAAAQLSQLQMLLAQATGLQPVIGPFPSVKVASGLFMGDVIFDNPFSDYKMRERVKLMNRQMRELYQQVKLQLHSQKERTLDSKNNLGEAKAQLAAARAELEKVRREVFEEVTGVKCTAGTPPAYDAMDSPPPPTPDILPMIR